MATRPDRQTKGDRVCSGSLRIIAFGCGLLGGLVASQGPEFAQQYRQRLGGGDRRAQTRGRAIRRGRAARTARPRQSAITRLRGNPDDLASRQGTAMQGNRGAPCAARGAPAGHDRGGSVRPRCPDASRRRRGHHARRLWRFRARGCRSRRRLSLSARSASLSSGARSCCSLASSEASGRRRRLDASSLIGARRAFSGKPPRKNPEPVLSRQGLEPIDPAALLGSSSAFPTGWNRVSPPFRRRRRGGSRPLLASAKRLRSSMSWMCGGLLARGVPQVQHRFRVRDTKRAAQLVGVEILEMGHVCPSVVVAGA